MSCTKSSAVTLFTTVMILLSMGRISAQAPAPTPAPAPAAQQPRQGGPNQQPQSIDLATAKKMVAAAEAAAAAQNQHIAVCVMDVRGDMVAFERGDTLNAIPVSTSQGKAHAVLLFGIPSGQIADAIKDGKPISATVAKAPMAGAENLSFMRGGLPIMKDGKMIGAIAVGGSASESDEAFAQAGIDAAFPKQ